MLLYIYTSNADVNTKSLPPRLGETRRRTAQHENRTDAALLSEIEAALASGKTWKQVWQCLADDGLDISYETFRKVLQRVRKKARISATPSGKSRELPDLRPQETAHGVARDPLENLKRLEENRPGFHWRATPSLKEPDVGRNELRGKSK